MSRRSLRSLLVAAIVAIAALGVTEPVLAKPVVGQIVGSWSLTDTSANPMAIGKYRYYASDGYGWLTRFWVNPPKMKAVAGKSAQTVGWTFKVERKDCGFFGCNHWHKTYVSPEQTAVTSDSHNASFTQATVGVNVPCGHNCEDLVSAYRVTVKMLWHRADGTVQGSVRHLVYWYGAQMTNGQSGVQEKTAGAAWSPDF